MEITKVDFHQDKGSINVFVDFPKGSVFRCPKCGKEVKAYDCEASVDKVTMKILELF
jgi:transcription initiation factor IIE alpha subunit